MPNLVCRYPFAISVIYEKQSANWNEYEGPLQRF